MVTVMMKLPMQGFAKHYDDMTEVENYGGGHHTRLKINLCVYGVPPSPVYKGGEGRPAGHKGRAQGGESYSK